MRQASVVLEVHEQTLRNWCRGLERGGPTRLQEVERDKRGHYKISERDVLRLVDLT